jgi:hypothetical protein
MVPEAVVREMLPRRALEEKRMRRVLIRFIFGLLAVSAIMLAREDSAAVRDWRQFRAAYPYHIQAVALSGEHTDGSRTLIVSEPPPHVTLAGLRELNPTLMATPTVETQAVGYDGWVKDIVVTINGADSRQIRTLVDQLHIFLFGSAYKAYALSVPPVGAPQPVRTGLNVRVSAADLDRWVFRSKELFTSQHGGPAAPVESLLAAGKSGIYYSQEPGLVALIAPKTAFSLMRRQLREFALDSDLILGATSYKNHVAILARERNVPVDALPPLRTETILLLAQAAPRFAELSQSYERTNVFAGQFDEDGWEWAPIYLSDILIDTEYGSLLNITDQILKSWSSDGEVQYFRFGYPVPAKWPFPQPIVFDAKAQQVTFNWNTKGAGYTVDFPVATGFRRVFSLNRTGALPVNYLPGQMNANGQNPLERYELVGYDYFAAQSDSNLVRVVQYASLYQIFREFGVTDTSRDVVKLQHPEWDYLASIGSEMAELVRSLDTRKTAGANEPNSKARAEPAPEIERLQRLVIEARATYGDAITSDIGMRMANPRIDSALQQVLESGQRTVASLTRAEKRVLTANYIALQLERSHVAKDLGELLNQSDPVYREYARETNGRSSGWIRTPSIVVSRTTGRLAAEYTGGHNLDSSIVKYRASAELKPGEIRIEQEGSSRIVVVSNGDVEKVPAVLRQAALARDPENLSAALRRELPRVTPLLERPRQVALELDPRQFTAERGLATKPTSRVALLGGWNEAPATAATIAGPNPAAEFSRLGTRAIAVEKQPDFTFHVYLPGSERPRVAMSYDAALDTVIDAMKNVDGPAGAWNLKLNGFDRIEANNFLRTAEVQFTAKEDLRLAGFSGGKGTSQGMLRVLGERYDFRKAVIRNPVVESGAESGRAGMEALRFDVEIPAIQTVRPSLVMRIRLFFRTRITEPVKLAVQSALEQFLGARVIAPTVKESPAVLGHKIFLDLKQDLKSMKLPGGESVDFEIEVHTDAGDMYVADAWSAGGALAG